MSTQLEFKFDTDIDMDRTIKKFPPDFFDELSKIDEPVFYRVNKFMDYVLSKLPYCLGWMWYHKYWDVKRYIISTYQKIRYGVSDQECWNLDTTIARFILPRLIHFKKMKRVGMPADLTEEEWETIIDESIWVFDYILDADKHNPFPYEISVRLDKNPIEMFSNKKTPEQEINWKMYITKSKQLQERKEKALANFAKYYEGFWD